jgi:hypothetical protein
MPGHRIENRSWYIKCSFGLTLSGLERRPYDWLVGKGQCLEEPFHLRSDDLAHGIARERGQTPLLGNLVPGEVLQAVCLEVIDGQV